MKRILLFLLAVFTVLESALAQTESPSSQLLGNLRLVNPSYAGHAQAIEGGVMYKDQWTGFEGAPKIINFDARVPVRKLLGVGLLGNYEKSGHRKNTLIGLTADVDVRLGRQSFLLFGLHLGAGMKRYDFGNAVMAPGEMLTENFDHNYFVGGYGVTWMWKKLTVGASHYISFLGEDEGEMYNVYAHGEYRLDFGPKWQLRPAVLYSYNNKWKNWVEPGLFCTYDHLITVGVSDRIDEHLTFSVDLQVVKQVSLAYSYDVNTGDVRKLSASSHEVGVRFTW